MQTKYDYVSRSPGYDLRKFPGPRGQNALQSAIKMSYIMPRIDC